MSKNNENKLVPKLRFPEFKNDGEWEKKSLNSVGNVVASGDLDEKTFSPTKTSEHIYPVYSNSVSQEGIYGYSSAFKYKSGSVTITARGTLGVAFERKADFVGIGRLLVISELKNTNANFLKENWNYKAKVPLENGGIPQLTAVKAKSISLLFPKLTEQQKIAACLSSLDEVITAESQKLEVLKDHKKGLLQNLLPQAGETVPEFRFKEFEDSGVWGEKRLGEIAELTSSKRVHLADYVSKGIPFFRGKEISQLKNNQVPDDILYISNEQYFEIKNKYGIPQKGDILITAVGTLGNVYCIKNDNPFYFKDGNLIWMKNISINSCFLEVLLDFDKEKILASAIGSSQKALTMAALNNLKFKIPNNPKEQHKIASTLSSIDDLITAQNQKIEALQLHKKGLLQGLFPNVHEVTA